MTAHSKTGPLVFATAAAGVLEAAMLATLQAELLGLRLVLPCHETPQQTETRHRVEADEAEDAFDNLPV